MGVGVRAVERTVNVTVASQDMRFYTTALSAALEALKVRNFVQTLLRRCMPATKLFDKQGRGLNDVATDMHVFIPNHAARNTSACVVLLPLLSLAPSTTVSPQSPLRESSFAPQRTPVSFDEPRCKDTHLPPHTRVSTGRDTVAS